jgi:hypothetical protein
MTKLRFVGVPGSLRKEAHSTGMLHAAVDLAPRDVRIEAAGVRGFPVFKSGDETNPPSSPASISQSSFASVGY